MPANEFSVYQFLPNDLYEKVREFVSMDEALKAFLHYTNNVATKVGITERVIITDGGDCVVAEWKKEEGCVFPPELVEVFKTKGLQK